MYVVTNRGYKNMRKTIISWKVLVKCAEDSEYWIALKDTKEAHPVKIAKFSKARNISD